MRVINGSVFIAVVAFILSGSLHADVSVTAGPGASIHTSWTVPVTISNVSDLFGYEFDLAFNPAILQLETIQEGAFLGTAGGTSFVPGFIDNLAGTASFTGGSLSGFGPGANGNGVLANFTFQAVSAGASPLTLSNVFLLDSNFNEIPAIVVDGSVDATTPEPMTGGWWLFALCTIVIVAVRHRRNAV